MIYSIVMMNPILSVCYQVYVEASCKQTYHYKVMVDGINVSSIWLRRGESKYVETYISLIDDSKYY